MIWNEMSYYKYKRQDNLHDIYEPDVFDVDEYIENELIRQLVFGRTELDVDNEL